MKKTHIVAAAIAASIMISPSVNAEEAVEEAVEDVQQNSNIDTLAPPSQELIEENPWVSSSSSPENQVPASQDEPETWAVIDENGKTTNIISCDIDFCGSGWIPKEYEGNTPISWTRVVLQSARDPITGNNNGGHWGDYNFSSNVWTKEVKEDHGYATYQVPVEYGSDPFCIRNCYPEENLTEEFTFSNDENSTQEDITNTSVEYPDTQTEARTFFVKTQLTSSNFSFSYRVHKNIRSKKIWIIANKDNEKIVWKFKVKKNNLSKIKLPVRYLDWNISINYKLKNGKRISKTLTM